MQNHYHYLFDADGQIRCHTNEVWLPTARTSLDGLRSTTWLGPFGEQQRDLLRVMAAVLEADRLSPRQLREGKRLERDLAWQRQLSLRIAVESPDRWTQAIPELVRLLSFMTDDAWHVEFDGFVKNHAEQQLLPFENAEGTTEVALFSGGLDSVAGMLELSRFAASDLPTLAAVAMSCDEGEGHKQDPMLHCGLCTSCLFRRIALRAGGAAPDATSYRDVSTKKHGVYEVNAFENHAARLLKCRAFEDLLDLDPDARFATKYPFSDLSSAPASGTVIFEMYERYAMEIQSYFDLARPKVAKRIQQPRKERERDLFSATR